MNEAAAKRDWRAYRAHKQLARTRHWEHHLINAENWQELLRSHFEGIFHQASDIQVHMAYLKTHKRLTRSVRTGRGTPSAPRN